MASEKLQADIVILGHIAKDIIEIDGVSRVAIGGSVYYGGIAGSHIGLKIIIITRLKKEDFPILDDFTKYGVKYFAYPSESNETSGLKNIYNSKNMEFRVCKSLGFAGLFKKEEIPEIYTKYFILGPIIAGEIDSVLLDYLSKKYKGKLCLDIQGFIRVRDKEKDEVNYYDLSQKEKEDILSRINILKIDQKEAEILTKEKDLRKAAKILGEIGPKEILISHEKGISLYAYNQRYFYPWKYIHLKGRTGRGDTAFISYVGSRITKDPEESLKFATALTSLKLENSGPFTLPLYQVESLIKKEFK
ncbi:MAG: hypothetical protein ACTSRI_12200 [Promethearchaeota archaeon]